MHSDVRIDIAGTPAVLDSTLSFASARFAFYRDKTAFGAWSFYTGARS